MWNLNLEVFLTVQTPAIFMSTLVCAHCFPGGKKYQEEDTENGIPDALALGDKEFQTCLGQSQRFDRSLVTRVFRLSRYHWIHSHRSRRGFSAPRLPFLER